MVGNMMVHWKNKGNIDVDTIRRITKQMWQAVAFIHSKSFVHRDIKGDNFLMDYSELDRPDNRIYLSDFGTVVEIGPDQRLSEKCGTKNYWSPEFYRRDYGLKV